MSGPVSKTRSYSILFARISCYFRRISAGSRGVFRSDRRPFLQSSIHQTHLLTYTAKIVFSIVSRFLPVAYPGCRSWLTTLRLCARYFGELLPTRKANKFRVVNRVHSQLEKGILGVREASFLRVPPTFPSSRDLVIFFSSECLQRSITSGRMLRIPLRILVGSARRNCGMERT